MAINTETNRSEMSSQEDIDSPTPLSVGDRVVDRQEDDEEFSPIRVVDGDVGRADEVTAGEKTVSEYEPNQQYPADDPVVKVVFEAKLDSYITGWEDHIDDLDAYLSDFADEWSVTVNHYHYPRSRLQEVPDTKIDS